MNASRLVDYLDHMRQAAMDARTFVEEMSKSDFLADKRTQQAVIMKRHGVKIELFDNLKGLFKRKPAPSK